MSVYYNMATQVYSQFHVLNSVLGQLEWDMFTRMPHVVNSSSAAQIKSLQRIAYSMLSSAYLGDYLDKALEDSEELSAWQACNLSFIREMHLLAKIVPLHLIEVINDCRLDCYDLWREACEKNDYRIVFPSLSELIKHTREYLQIKSDYLGTNSVYEAALRSFEPDLSSVAMDGFFSHIGDYMSENLGEIINARKGQRHGRGVYALSKQEELLNDLLQSTVGNKLKVGVVLGSGIDRVFYEHDSFMMATSLAENDFTRGIRQVMGNIGQSLFYLGRSEDSAGQPAGGKRGQVLSETISALFSYHITGSAEFADFIQPTIQKIFSGRTRSWDVEECRDILSRCVCSLNRQDCGELFAMAHLMMRYSIEKELLSGNLNVEDLPDAWHEGSRRYFKSTPKSYSEGCLQDSHWYQGMFGYFPAHAMGIMLSSKLAASTQNIVGGSLVDGFPGLIDWLQTNLVEGPPGLSTQELISHVTGGNFKISGYLNHLQSKYSCD